MTDNAPVATFNIPQRTFYFLDLENGEEDVVNKPSVRSIAESVYGREYHAISWSEPSENGTSIEYELDAETCEMIFEDDGAREIIEKWLALDPNVTDHSRTGPDALHVLVDLIAKGHLPFGTYLINLSY